MGEQTEEDVREQTKGVSVQRSAHRRGSRAEELEEPALRELSAKDNGLLEEATHGVHERERERERERENRREEVTHGVHESACVRERTGR